MKLYSIGNAIYHYREKNKISQTQVCEGICTEMTLSRIETGERECDFFLSEILMERLGKTVNHFELFINDEDYYYYVLRENIEKAVEMGKLEQAKCYIEEYRNNMPTTHVLHEQFLIYYEVLIMKAEDKPKKDIVECLYCAINLTRPDFIKTEKRLRLYSKLEIKIIYELLLCESFSYEVLCGLFYFVDEMYDEEEKGRLQIPFLYHYAQQYKREEKWFELERVTSRGIGYLQAGRTYLYLAEFQFMNLLAERELYKNTVIWEKKRVEFIQRCNAIYYMSMIIEDSEMMKKAERFCEEQLECQVTT